MKKRKERHKRNYLAGLLTFWMFSLGVLIIFLLYVTKEYRVLDASVKQLKTEVNSEERKKQKETETHILETTQSETSEVEETEAETENNREDISLIFGGDLLLSGAILRQYDNNGGIQGLIEESLLSELVNADISMVNQEFPFSERGTPMEGKEYTFQTPPSRINILEELGIDIVSLANNHTLDYGREALLDTFKTLEDSGISYVGAGENLDRAKQMEVIEIANTRVGFLSASRVIPVASWNASNSLSGIFTTYSADAMLKEIEEARELCDLLIVYVHWGVEFEERPASYQVKMAKAYIESGADMVIGSHPHVVQGVEYHLGKPIIYSLGNFIFGNTIKEGMLLKADYTKDNLLLISIIPFTSPKFQLQEMVIQEKSDFFQYIEDISYGIEVDYRGIIREK
ncbi:MAG: CapA family protein [Clostridiales bacterium]|nr:CapA family protein [Clostridiales bacterium]